MAEPAGTSITVTCAACGGASDQFRLGRIDTVGFPDLDLRPPEMRRSTMRYWLQDCPSCGFVAPDIGKIDEIEKAAMNGPEWAALMAGRGGAAALSNRFERRSFLERAAARDGLAAFRMLCAAWDADDRGDTEGARACRTRAVPLFEAALDGPPTPQQATDWLLQLVDVLRRLGRWDEAGDRVGGLFDDERIQIQAIGAFQARMIREGDDARFSIAIAMEEA
jgi:hypothetical protein